MSTNDDLLLQISIAEYQELLEEIRSGRAVVWVAFGAYLALTGALLGVLGPTGLFAITVPIIMASLGVVIGFHIYRVRQDNNINFNRVWDIELGWQSSTLPAAVGMRWNPWDSRRLERTWRLPDARPREPPILERVRRSVTLLLRIFKDKGDADRKTLGMIDFSLIVVVSLVADLWAIDFLAVLEGLAAFTLGWLMYYLLLVLATLPAVLLTLRDVARHEHAVIDKWRDDHPPPTKAESPPPPASTRSPTTAPRR